MSSSPERTPKYRHYKPKDLGVVRIDGRDFYLGKYGSPESWEKYHRLLAERYARGPGAAPRAGGSQAEPDCLTITELCVRYYRHAEGYYVKNGKHTTQLGLIKSSLKTLRSLYGTTLAKDFSPLALKACRAEFIRQGLSRRECNRRTRLIRQAFKWAGSEEVVPPSVYHGLQTVSGLVHGRCEAPDPKPVGPVPETIVERTIDYLAPTLEAMIRLQLATAMRPGEVCILRACDLNMSGPIWEYRPETYKTEHHDVQPSRVIMLGPKAQEIIRPFLTLDTNAYLFSPRRAVTEQIAERRAGRKTPLWDSHVRYQAKERGRRGRKPLTDHYDDNSYRRAIARACDQAFPHPVLGRIRRKNLTPEQRAELKAWQSEHRWHPNQLRHSAATAIRRKYGAEAAQCVLGHAQLSTTEIYAEKSLEAARQIAREIG
jgi:integrase